MTRTERAAELDKLTQHELDSLVHDAKSQEASAINNEGRDEQIVYLLCHEFHDGK